MGLVDFAIDLAAVVNASRSVASKHVALRGRQLERYGQTSSVAAALKGQKTRRPAESERAPGVEKEASAAVHASRDGYQDVPIDLTSKDPDGMQAGEVEISTAPDDSRVPGSATVPPSVLRSSAQQTETQKGQTRDATDQESRIETHSTHSPPQSPRLPREKGGGQGVSVPQPSEAAEEAVPEGVNLDIFQTSRGGRLSPLWKGDKPGIPEKPTIPEGVDLGVFRTSRGSNILKELEHRRPRGVTASKLASNLKLEDVPKAAQTNEEPTSAAPVKRVQSDSQVAKQLQAQESVRETEEVEVPRYPNPTNEESTAKPFGQMEKPPSKEDASQLGEMIGAAAATPKYELRESSVPSSRLGRIWNYSGLAAGMFAGTISEGFSRVIGGGGEGSLMLSPANMERLVAKLSKMRGAALKIGQMLSFQDSKMLPAPIQEVLQRVQDRADYMPAWQRDRVLATNLGAEWRDLFDEFEDKPIAAASIGQVHRATLKSNGAKVAVKIQFPGVADSINSDLDNLGILLAATKLLPKGLYLNKTIDNARTELAWECDYERELKCAQRYRDLLATEDDVFSVPKIYPEASGKQVLTMEFMEGVGVTRIKSFTQEQRDWIGTQILRLCLREITEFHFMQTDPNWTNFLYNSERDRLVLLDFGASREYPERFITLYVQLLAAASRTDRDTVKELSEKLGYLTGHESKTMLDAHTASVLTLAEPFLESAPEVYDFRDQTITERVKAQIPVMIRERLAPPPEETYSLHRKLSGAFLLCARLGSRVRCREMFEKSVAESGVLGSKVE